MSSRDVAVVGMSCVFPGSGGGADGVERFWRNVAGGVDSIRDLPAERWAESRLHALPPEHEGHIGCRRGGFVSTPYLFDPLRHRVMPKIAQHGDVDQFILCDVLADALDDAGLGEGHPLRETTDVIVGRGNTTSNKMLEVFLRSDGFDRILAFLERRLPELGAADLEALEADMRASLPPRDPDGMATAITNFAASRAANRLDLGGVAFLTDAACASSLVAIELGMARLRDGKCDVAIASGINFGHVPGFWYLMSSLGALSPSGRIRPFDRAADGILMGEGAGAVVLKRVEDARRDGDRVYAVVKGAGSSSDGRAKGILAPSSPGQVRALEAAYADAGVSPDTIDLLEAHGTGTPTGDEVEIETIRTVYGGPPGGVPTRVMGSVKSMIGHTMPAAGMASFIKVALALANKILPPSLHCDEPAESLASIPFFVPPTARPWLKNPETGPRRGAVNAFGFGGVNAHVVLEEVPTRVARGAAPTRLERDGPPAAALTPRPIRTGVPRPTELLAFAAGDERGVAARLRTVAAFLRTEGSAFELEDLAWTLAREAGATARRCRLGLIREAREPRGDLADALEAFAGRVESGELATDENAGIFWAGPDAPSGGRIAAVFPGIAFPGLTGEFPEHLLANCLHFPAFRAVFDRVEDRDANPADPLPTSVLLVPPRHLPEAQRARLRNRFAPPADASESDLQDIADDGRNLSHMGILVNNWACWQILQHLGIPVDMLCGQSLGDLSAVLAAGMTDFEESIPGFWRAFNLEVPYQARGSIVMVGASEDEIAPLLAEIPDVSIGVHLSPKVLMVGGSDEGTKELAERLRARNVLAQKLPFPPIHTPQLVEYQERLAEAIGETAPMRRGRITIYSAVLAAPMSDDPEEVADVLRSNVSRPVRFWQTLHRMVDDGARFVIQIGSGSLAAGSRTIIDRDDVVSVAMDVGHRHPLTQIQTMCGMLHAGGLRLDLEKLFAARAPRRLDLDAPAPAPGAPAAAVPLVLYWPPLYEEAERARRAPDVVAAEVAADGEEAREPATTFPLLGRVEAYEPGERIVTLKRLELDGHPYLADHVFLNLAGAKPLRDQGAVLPLSFTIEMLAETAACLAPGQGLVGVEDVRATRWIAFEGVDALDVRVEARRAPDAEADRDSTRVEAEAFVDGQPVARGTVRFGARYRETLRLAFREPTNPRPFPMAARDVYELRHYFHGPSFHCLDSLDLLSDEGVAGEVVVRSDARLFRGIPAPQILLDPVVLDGAGQVLGAFFIEREISVLPASVDAIEVYRPRPPVGTRVPVRVEFTEIDETGRRTKANIEVQDGAGGVWFRVLGWQDVLFRCTPAWNESQRRPDRRTFSRSIDLPGLPEGAEAAFVSREDARDVPLDWLACSCLDAEEARRARAFPDGKSRARAAWLLGRVAAKDAVRRWRARVAGDERMLHPARVVLENDADGRPRVASAGAGALPRISIAHTDAGAVAVAADAPVGVDVEPLDAGARLVLADFSTEAERALLDALPGAAGEPARATLLWCAKEAAAKALGTGLGGRPRAFELVEADGSGRLCIRHAPSDRLVELRGVERDGLIFVAGTVRVVAAGVGAP